MKLTFERLIILSLLIFAVLEKSGVSVMSLIIADNAPSFEIVVSDTDGTKEAESAKEVSVKEAWVSINGLNSLCPVCRNIFIYPSISRDQHVTSFYPPIPTPPPNFS